MHDPDLKQAVMPCLASYGQVVEMSVLKRDVTGRLPFLSRPCQRNQRLYWSIGSKDEGKKEHNV